MKEKTAILLQNIRSIHNVGAFFRTADGAGFEKIYCCGYSPTPDDPRMNKVALGAEQEIAWEQRENILEVIKELKKEGFQIIAIETGKNAEDIFEASLISPFGEEEIKEGVVPKVALIFGHEVDGISDDILEHTDRIFKIPMRGIKESLNVSVSAGVAMYEVMRKLRK